MKNIFKFAIFFFMLVFCSFIIGCNGETEGKDSGNVSIIEFNTPMDDMVDIGTTYTLKNVSARDDQGGYYMAKINIVDPDGQAVELNKLSFKCSKFGTYVVTYTVSYNETDQIARTFKIEVTDVTEPEVTTNLYEHNISSVGKTVDLNQFVVSDNSGEELTHTTKVYFNGYLDESSIENDILTLAKEGCYTIEVTATDSSDNTMNKEFNIYTIMDFEAGYYFINPSYSSEITERDAYDGEHSYSLGAFDNHFSYFNDFSLLGCVQVLDTQKQYVSFWVKFENPNYVNILKARYHETVIYDVYGDELPAYDWPDTQETGETGYELFGNRWYKVVVDLNNVVNKGEIGDAPGEIVANPQSLDLIPFYWGVWDSVNNTSATRAQKVLIDNIILTDDQVGDFKAPEKPDYAFPENCIADFETEEQLTALVGSWNTQLSINTEIKSSGNSSLKMIPYAEWSHFGIKGVLGIDELNSYNTIAAKVYVEDLSSFNAYDEDTYVVVELRHTFDNQSYTIVGSAVIDEVSSWIDVEFNLGAYSQYALSDRSFDVCVYKYLDGNLVSTGSYESFAIYIDDIYVK